MNSAKAWFWILLDAFLVVLVVSAVCFGMPALQRFNNSLAASRTITVSAQGMTTASPDTADISFSVLSQGQDPQSLSANNTQKMNAVLQFVSSQNIASSDIQTTAYDLEPNYQYDKVSQKNIINGYTLTQTVTVKIRNLNNVATVLGGLAPLGVNEIGGVTFTIDDDTAVVAAARADAFAKAETKAQSMAQEAGVSLGQVVNVSENSVVPFPYYANTMSYGATAGGVAASVPAPSIQPGSQQVTDNISITYSLR